MLYLELFYEFFKTGLFAVGGGLATLPFLSQMSENHPDWFSLEDLGNMVAVSNATPGPLGINMATYVGYTTGGILGGLIATIALVMPAIIVIMIIIRVLERFKQSKQLEAVFTGLRPAVTAMIALAGIQIVNISIINVQAIEAHNPAGVVNWLSLIFAAAMFVFIKKVKLPIIAYIAVGAVFGIAVRL